MTRRQARPVRPRADRSVVVDGTLYRVKIRDRFMPVRELRPGSEGHVGTLRWLFWSMPVWLLRRLLHRVDWTVTVFVVRKEPALRIERRVHSEHVSDFETAVRRADALIRLLEDRAPLG